jgi:hypothetical protein
VDLFPLAAGGVRSIRALRSAVTREEAIRAFSGGLAGHARRLRLGPLRSIADVYVPFRLYRISIGRAAASGVENAARFDSSATRRADGIEHAVIGVDAVTGTLDLYRFERTPEADQVVGLCTRNGIDAALPVAALHEIALTRVRRMVYGRRGFLVAGRMHIDVEPVDAEVHVPYWAGFFGGGEAARIVVMDAVRRQIEGPKVRRLIGRWLAPSAG